MSKHNINLFIPCFVDQIYPQTGFNIVKVLEKAGCKVHYNPEQTCCGQPAFNSGYWDEAFEVASKFIYDFPEDRYIITAGGSCTGFVRNYFTDLFQNSSLYTRCKTIQKNVYEFSEFLVDVLGVTDLGAELNGKAVYHDACGALRECGIKEAPRRLLSFVKGLTLVEMKEAETCCGFGGAFSVKFEPVSIGMAEQKINSALEKQADYLISTDASCLMHLDGFIKFNKHSIKTMHLADVLACGW